MLKMGLVGRKIGYSYSPEIYNFLAQKHQIELDYQIINCNELTDVDFSKYQMLNFTIPYKQEVLKKDCIKSKEVEKYTSANLWIKNKKMLYSTDQLGIQYTIEKILQFDLNKVSVIILGTGAMAQMVKELVPNSIICSRKPNDNQISYDQLSNYKADLLINCTPIGTLPNYDYIPIESDLLINFKAVFDMTYNPYNSRLLLAAKLSKLKVVNGLPMLVVQALENLKIFFKIEYSQMDIDELQKYIEDNIIKKKVIIGMSLAGKSTFLKNNYPHGIDLDSYISEKNKIEITDFITTFGIEKFRQLESKSLKEVVKNNSEVICPGAGFILNNQNINLLTEYVFIYLKVDLEVLEKRFLKSQRPLLSNNDDLKKQFAQRIEIYKYLADYTIQ